MCCIIIYICVLLASKLLTGLQVHQSVGMWRQGRNKQRSDRLLHPAISHGAADHLADLDEEDVWSSVAAPAAAAESTRSSSIMLPRPEPDRRRWPVPARGGLSLAFDAHNIGGAATATPAVIGMRRHHHVASSAPVSVPECRSAVESERDDEWLPPHEYLQARSGAPAVATSVLEGVGRTLKGRDMSRVRDAVWNNTGFFG